MVTQQSKKGFTIIEVVLVLAIAGLIFLMVFIALPALQRSQRDQARKNDASVVASAINTWGSATRRSGNLTTETLRKYVDKLDQYNKNDGNEMKVESTNARIQVGLNQIKVMTGKRCPANLTPGGNPSTVDLQQGSSRNAVVVVLLENNGSQYQPFCQEV